MTAYDNSGLVRWRGNVQMVYNIKYETGDDATAPIAVPGSSVGNGLVVDCSAVQFEWRDARTEYTE